MKVGPGQVRLDVRRMAAEVPQHRHPATLLQVTPPARPPPPQRAQTPSVASATARRPAAGLQERLLATSCDLVCVCVCVCLCVCLCV